MSIATEDVGEGLQQGPLLAAGTALQLESEKISPPLEQSPLVAEEVLLLLGEFAPLPQLFDVHRPEIGDEFVTQGPVEAAS